MDGGAAAALDLLLAGRRIAVVHGGPSRINRFVFVSTPEPVLAAELALPDGRGDRRALRAALHPGIGARLWHNSGAIGLPANDGTPRGWFSLLAPRTASDPPFPSTTIIRRGGAMRGAGLPEGYAERWRPGSGRASTCCRRRTPRPPGP